MANTYKYDVFVSYAKEDEEAARRLYVDLSKTGLDVWLDKERLLPGQDWDREIRTALRASRFFVLLISEHSVDKQGYVQKEVRLALDLFNEFPPGEVFAIPVRLDDSKPRHDELLRLQWCDLFRSWEMSVNG